MVLWMKKADDAERAIATLNGLHFMGRILRYVDRALFPLSFDLTVAWNRVQSYVVGHESDFLPCTRNIQVHVSFLSQQAQPQINEALLSSLLSARFGPIADCLIKRYSVSYHPCERQSGYGFVFFETLEGALRAVSILTGKRGNAYIDGICLDCKVLRESYDHVYNPTPRSQESESSAMKATMYTKCTHEASSTIIGEPASQPNYSTSADCGNLPPIAGDHQPLYNAPANHQVAPPQVHPPQSTLAIQSSRSTKKSSQLILHQAPQLHLPHVTSSAQSSPTLQLSLTNCIPTHSQSPLNASPALTAQWNPHIGIARQNQSSEGDQRQLHMVFVPSAQPPNSSFIPLPHFIQVPHPMNPHTELQPQQAFLQQPVLIPPPLPPMGFYNSPFHSQLSPLPSLSMMQHTSMGTGYSSSTATNVQSTCAVDAVGLQPSVPLMYHSHVHGFSPHIAPPSNQSFSEAQHQNAMTPVMMSNMLAAQNQL